MMTPAARFLVVFLAVLPSFAADLELRFGALERIIASEVFTQDGRRYVRGTPATKCQYAYLEAPHIGNDNGRLRVKARFSGRTALDLFGRCVGLGDSFDLTVTATPFPHNGAIGLKDVKVTTEKDSYYIRRVRNALNNVFAKDFKIEVQDQARKILEKTRENSSYQQELASFSLTEVRVTQDALVLVVDFHLVVK
jgi:hypothetical protein